MNERGIRERGQSGSGGWLESACKLIVAIRAGLLLVTLVSLIGSENDTQLRLTALAIVAAGLTSLVPLLYWHRVGPVLVRHPGYFAAELVLSTVILVLTGTESPFFYYTLATALLGGLLYGWPRSVWKEDATSSTLERTEITQ